MKVSIIVPLYNQIEYVEEALGSALAQTIPSEIIVINDGSTDGGGILVSTKFPQVKLVNQVNKGLSSARNTGIMNATGDYILPLDSDDVLMPNCVEKILEVAEVTHADIIAPSLQEFGISNAAVTLKPSPTLEDFKIGNHIGYFSAVKRSVLLEVGGYNPKMVWGYEDYDLWFDLLKRGKTIVTIPEHLVMYRTKERSMIHVANEHKAELMSQIFKNHPEVWGK